MFRAEVTVTLRSGILDVQGKTVEHSLHALGYDNVGHVRIGKFVTLEVDAETPAEAERIANEVSQRLLSNPVIEDFDVTINEVERVV